jgi:spermidine/putrescine transport system permease protein|tara:strand:- start:406 stop:1263 length:858 start_codon:yes stop_codon:yes gene_type:complete
VERQDQRIGLWSAVPMGVVLLISFLAPLLVIAVFSVMPQKVFSLLHLPDFSSYKLVFTQGYIKSVVWSFGMALASTVMLFVICWPLAFGMAKVFKGFGLFITIAVVVTLFVSENIRLFGWVLTLMKGGLIEGHLRAWTGLTFEGALYNVPVIVFGLVYAYFPFMLFPLIQGIAMVPDDARQAAADLGASRWQIFYEVDLPLSAPGIVIGSLLSFVLAAGAMAESKLLGGQTVIVIADEIETAFTYGQNWPLGSALSIILILIIGALSIFGINRVNLDLIMGGRRS